MTNEEAQKVAAIMMTVDGGCPYCAGDLLKQFAESFPGFEDVIEAEWDKDYTHGGWRR